jgi:surfeit locus 1 family protein
MPVRSTLLAVLSVAAALVCVRLGVWQLDRRAERQAYNAEAAARLDAAPMPLREVRGDSATVRLQRVSAEGVFRYEREFALTGRSRNGSPGAHVVTPLTLPGSDTLVLVLRGWVYSADAATVDFTRWREPDTALIEGYVLPLPAPQPESDSSAVVPNALRRLDRPRLEARLGAPIADFYVVQTAGGGAGEAVPVRLAPPMVTDEGTHFSYAMQWFLFATIFGVGGPAVVFRAKRYGNKASATEK